MVTLSAKKLAEVERCDAKTIKRTDKAENRIAILPSFALQEKVTAEEFV